MTPSQSATAFRSRRAPRKAVVHRQVRLTAQITFCVRGVISPLLANIYLHHAFDQWIHAWRKAPGRGCVIAIRYADDSVVGFEKKETALRFLDQLRERLAKFGLSLHQDKTRLIEFGRFAAERRSARAMDDPRPSIF